MQNSKRFDQRKIEILVGFFVLTSFLALLMLSLKVATSELSTSTSSYTLFAKFDNIGGLKVRAPIKVGGVVIGRVASIALDPTDWVPVVEMRLDADYNRFTDSTSASILTSGLLGEQYIGLQPGFEEFEEESIYLADGDKIPDTKSALVLEDLIGQFLYSQSK
ncbi:outer membrane lipid asymmetry maintenance protein MlaD [Corallincola luteus]|uniref:Outer membrane lipid asymmetry maintenance protein MlaD n=1 Tax=Corallincola luteus TaxID=1775177 RepID=A0ABY2AKZ7_9GAMM|nr:outer membrane lipid asymmetry maintenance protein MlaD [Corallincola luteus]TCI03559.1 outer membrane lipid asymmetry maintenance protein MlaD [Corallincola luteus]